MRVNTEMIAIAIASVELTSMRPLRWEDPDSEAIQMISERMILHPEGGREKAMQEDCLRAARAILRMFAREKVTLIDA